MKSYNKKKANKHEYKNKRSIIKKRSVVKNVKEFDRIIKGNGSDVTCVFAKDKNNKRIGVYAIRYNENFICQDVLCEGRLYSVERNEGYESYFGVMPVINGYFIEIDAYPVFRDWVEFPITNVEFIDSNDDKLVCEKLIEYEMYSIIDPKDEDALEYIKYFNDISKGFQCKNGNNYFNSEDFSYGMIERGDIKRVNWLKSHGVKIYKVLNVDGGIITKIEEL